MKISSGVCLALPPLLAGAGLRTFGPESAVLLGAAAGAVLLYAGIWLLLRPTRFEVTPEELLVVFPLRRIAIPRASIIAARPLDRAGMKSEFGFALRVGAGGLWGGFGFLWSLKRGRVDMFVSRTDAWALVERAGAPPLLLSPDDAAAFAAALV